MHQKQKGGVEEEEEEEKIFRRKLAERNRVLTATMVVAAETQQAFAREETATTQDAVKRSVPKGEGARTPKRVASGKRATR